MSTNSTAIVAAVALTSFLGSACSGSANETGDRDRDAAIRALVDQYDSALLPPEDRDNAALLYQRAIAALDSAGITTDEWLLEGESPAGSGAWDPDLADSILEKCGPALSLAREASQLPWADFGIDRARGNKVLQPHLAPMRRLSSLMAMEVRALRARGQDAAAHALLDDLCSFARHTASDRLPLASLAASATCLQAMQGIDEAIALGAVSQDDAIELRKALGSADDPFHYADAVQGERDLIIPWLQANPVTALTELGLSPEMIDSGAFDEEIAGLNAGFKHAEEILRVADPRMSREMLVQFEEAVEVGAFGALGEQLLANHPRLVRVKIDIEQRLEATQGALRKIQLGADPVELANAATLYEFAFPYVFQLNTAEQDVLETVRRYASVVGSTDGLPAATREHARAILKRLTPARELIERAAWCEQCSWSQAEDAKRLGHTISEGAWVRPMRALARLRLVDAVLALEDDRQIDAELAIADALAVGLHLADGSHLLGSTVASATISEVAEIVSIAQDASSFPSDDLAHSLFEQRLRRMDHNDLLAWDAARSSTMRVQMVDHLAARFNINRKTAIRKLVTAATNRLASISYLLVEDTLPIFEYRFEGHGDVDHGSLLELTDVVKLDDPTCRRLRIARRHVDQVFMIIDDTRPIDADTWRTRGIQALESILEATTDAGRGRIASASTRD